MTTTVGYAPHTQMNAMSGVGPRSRPSLYAKKRPATVVPTSSSPQLDRTSSSSPSRQPNREKLPALNIPKETTQEPPKDDELPVQKRRMRPSLRKVPNEDSHQPSSPAPVLERHPSSSLSPEATKQPKLEPLPLAEDVAGGISLDSEPRVSTESRPSIKLDSGVGSPQLLTPSSPTKKISVEPSLDTLDEDEGMLKPESRTRRSSSPVILPSSSSPTPPQQEMKKSRTLRNLFHREPKDDAGKSRSWGHRSSKLATSGGKRGSQMRNFVSAPSMPGRSQTTPSSLYKQSGGAPGERDDDTRLLHRLTVQSVAFLSHDACLREEGIFRIPGDLTKLKQMRQQFLSTGTVDFTSIRDPHLVAGLLKLHLRELKFSIIPAGNPTKDLLDAAKTQNTPLAKRCLDKLPFTNHEVLKELVRLFDKIASNCEANLMCPRNIGKSCGPSLFHGYGVTDAAVVLQFLIENNHLVLNTGK